MIKYNTVQNRYNYKQEDIEKILGIIQNGDFYNMDNCTQENIISFVRTVSDFMTHMDVVQENVELERHETEDEAREYFGEDFVAKFDQLLTALDKQETMVALHGTNPEICPMICENGLQYKLPSLSSTAVQQHMAYGQHEMHYDNYEGLLNWGHKNYKGLVILAIPYECYYKEGFWNQYQETNTSFYGGQDYRIDPDFVVGYIDVNKKQIVINPKYNRQHNYEGYIKDNELFREQPDMDNNKIKQAIIASEAQIEQELSQQKHEIVEEPSEEQLDISRIPYIIEDLIGTFNSIKFGFPNGMTEERYKYFLEELSHGFNDIAKMVPLLKTNEQVRKEQEERYAMFNTPASTQSQSSDDFDWGENFDWGDDLDWGSPVEEPKGRSM